jgi:hypothetical protein
MEGLIQFQPFVVKQEEDGGAWLYSTVEVARDVLYDLTRL